jgi:hypothetical protein
MFFEAIFMAPMIARTIRISIIGNSHVPDIEGWGAVVVLVTVCVSVTVAVVVVVYGMVVVFTMAVV